jgi:hypothetical protein
MGNNKFYEDNDYIGFEVLIATSIKGTILWVVTPCSLWNSTDVPPKRRRISPELRGIATQKIVLFMAIIVSV